MSHATLEYLWSTEVNFLVELYEDATGYILLNDAHLTPWDGSSITTALPQRWLLDGNWNILVMVATFLSFHRLCEYLLNWIFYKTHKEFPFSPVLKCAAHDCSGSGTKYNRNEFLIYAIVITIVPQDVLVTTINWDIEPACDIYLYIYIRIVLSSNYCGLSNCLYTYVFVIYMSWGIIPPPP